MKIFATDTELLSNGALPYYLGTSWMWFRHVNGTPDTSQVDVKRIDYAISEARKKGHLTTEPFVIDIEEYSLATNYDFAVTQLLTALRRVKSTLPDLPIGLYSLIPERNYWHPVLRAEYLRKWNRPDQFWLNDSKCVAWRNRNEAASQAIIPHADFVVVDVYALYPYEDGTQVENKHAWRVYADANIAEAIRVAQGKQVFAILIPSYGKTAIEPDKWRMMVEFISAYPGVKALMIHTSSGYVYHEDWRKPVVAAMK